VATMKIAVIYFEILWLTFTFSCCLSAPTASDVKNKFYWYNRNYELIKQRIKHPENLPRVKNVILFVGDGMGMTTVTASRTYKQQKTKNEEAKLAFDDFPATAFVKTDTANSQISESAAAATALFCGVKTNFENLGVDASAGKDGCSNIESHTSSIISWAQSRNLKTGLVSFLNDIEGREMRSKVFGLLKLLQICIQ
jgi:alkaline phosphatase